MSQCQIAFCCVGSGTLAIGYIGLSNVYNAVYDARVKWYEIGMVLSVDIATLDSISDLV